MLCYRAGGSMSFEMFGCEVTIDSHKCIAMVDEDRRMIRVKPAIPVIVGERIVCEQKKIDARILGFELSTSRRWLNIRY
jgi:hypothetical protein